MYDHRSKRQDIDINNDDIDISELKRQLQTHVAGAACDNCRDVLEREIGNHMFYLASLCNVLDLNIYDILLKEYDKIETLGKFSMR